VQWCVTCARQSVASEAVIAGAVVRGRQIHTRGIGQAHVEVALVNIYYYASVTNTITPQVMTMTHLSTLRIRFHSHPCTCSCKCRGAWCKQYSRHTHLVGTRLCLQLVIRKRRSGVSLKDLTLAATVAIVLVSSLANTNDTRAIVRSGTSAPSISVARVRSAARIGCQDPLFSGH
jgi:hypothetical protein